MQEKRLNQINIHNKKQRRKKTFLKIPEFLKSSRGCDSSEHTKTLKILKDDLRRNRKCVFITFYKRKQG